MALAGTTSSSVACRGAASAIVGGRGWWILHRPFGKLPSMPGKRCPPRDFNSTVDLRLWPTAEEPEMDSSRSKMRDLAEKKYGKVPSGDAKPNSWTLLDYGDVVVHIFLPQQRKFYNLEEFYGNATLIELPFENQPPFRPTN